LVPHVAVFLQHFHPLLQQQQRRMGDRCKKLKGRGGIIRM
jgi:hypothetical protein